jgi:zinc transporter 5/7
MQGMFLHIVADTLGSVGVIISSILIELYGWTSSDPVCSLFIAVMILASVWPLLKSSAMSLLQRVPNGYEAKMIEATRMIEGIPDVLHHHSAHVWELSSGVPVVTICVQIIEGGDDARVLREVSDVILRVLGSRHSTVQVFSVC